MSQDATVNAADIARLGEVGRAAVSNWRRRYADFPQPVGGTASSPLFSLREVEDWLRRNGKSYEISLGDRVWQRLRAAGDDLRLGRLVGLAGEILLRQRDNASQAEAADPALVGLITEFGAQRGPAEAFEFLCARYLEAHSRRLTVTPDQTAALMVRLVGASGTVLDPACGLGTLLLAATPAVALGQDSDDTLATITATRLRLRGTTTTVVAADSLRDNGFVDRLADTVVCDPPFNERAWGHDQLTGDPRWAYGLPPRGESELAWAQHCLAQVRPGGLVAILMPQAAASRRAGRRIRGNLLRAGALRAVVTLGATGPDLWLLRRPVQSERSPSHVVLLPHDPDDTPASIEAAVAPALGSGATGTTRIIDLLDDDIDVSPARQTDRGRNVAAEFTGALDALRAVSVRAPALAPLEKQRALPVTTVGELAKAGLLTVLHGPARTAEGGHVPVLTADDLATGRSPSGWTDDVPGLIRLQQGDVVASPTGLAAVVAESGAALGQYLTLYRPDPEHLDPDFLAGVLRSTAYRPAQGPSRLDVRRTSVPLLDLAEQRAYGRAFRELVELERTVRTTAELGESLVRLGFAGLTGGRLGPAAEEA